MEKLGFLYVAKNAERWGHVHTGKIHTGNMYLQSNILRTTSEKDSKIGF